MIHSFSKLKCFEQCAFKYRMRYIEKLADEPGKAALAGTLIYSIL